MGRRLPEQFIKRDVLIDRLKLPKRTKLGKDELVLQAFDAGLITQSECEASFTTNTSTIPCYLYTHVQDPKVRELIESYVLAYSMLYTRGSWLANLACIEHCSELHLPESFPTPDSCVSIPSFLTDENLTKHCFLPERWLRKDKVIDPTVKHAYDSYKDSLNSLLPEYGKLMSDCGWDNAINHMGTSYLGNVHVMICTHLLRRLKIYVMNHHQSNPESSKLSIWFSIIAPMSPNSRVHEDDYEWAIQVRESLLKANNKDVSIVDSQDIWLYAPEELDDYVWTLHLWLVDKLKNGQADNQDTAYLPVSTLNRKYAYIDEKVYTSLVPHKVRKSTQDATKDHTGSNLQKLLGLTRQLFNKRRSKMRKDLRKRYSTNGKKLKRKWKKLGHGCLPIKSVVNVIKTDGVGLRIYVQKLPDIQEVRTSLAEAQRAKARKELEKDDMFKDAFEVGTDTGRVKIATAVDQDDNVFMITRKAFYRSFRDHLDKKFEKTRMTETQWGEAIAALSQAGGFKNGNVEKWKATLNAFSTHQEILIQEQLVDKTRAIRSMRRFRWKKAFMDQSAKLFVEKAIRKKQRVVIGIGDGDFPSTGRGEKSVPTKGFLNTITRVLKIHHIKDLVKVKKINEYNTTKCCHRCHNVMKTQTTRFGRECLRYRLCVNCSNKTVDKRRNRDVNAAKNIRNLLHLEMQGLPRPPAFKESEHRRRVLN